MTVGSLAPQLVVSPEMGSTMKTAEMLVGSAAAAGVRAGGDGGAPAAPGAPQLKRPPAPPTSTAPAGQPAGGPVPELAQSPATPVRDRIDPSRASQPDGAATAVTVDSTVRAAATAAARGIDIRQGINENSRSYAEWVLDAGVDAGRRRILRCLAWR